MTISLKNYTTFRMGGDAELFLLENHEDVETFFKNEQLFYILGGGSNILVSDKAVTRPFVQYDAKDVFYEEKEDGATVTISSGENWDEFVGETVEKGYGTLANLSLIPGSVGASPVQNIGAYGSEVVEGLRRSHKYRHTQRKQEQDEEMRGKIKDMLSIHERPVEVANRTIPGHWEGDLIIGKYKRTAVATLVERTTRYTMLVPLPFGKDAVAVREALVKKLHKLPTHILKTLTYDQGKEMSQHTQFTIDTGMQVYFADPASPWQRGTNENTNGLIRQYFPKGTDFALVSEQELQEAEDSLNGRPRKCIDWQFPKDVFYKLVALDSRN